MTDLRSRLEAHLGDRYALVRELGAGGMATVFLATDTKHDRRVALKVLRPEVADAIGAERFLREIETVARLTHPHILPLHDSGEAGGLLYYVMPYVEGESLRARIEREGALPIDDAIEITRDCADGLAYAHERGVIHRDIKPANVLLSGGHAILADFGIARALEAAVDRETLTRTGVSIGTVGYMSPEQAAGERKLDARTDVYALGLVLYEMLAGEPAFRGPTAQAVMARQVSEGPPSVSTVRRTVPAALEGVVEKACRTTPGDRYASAAELGEALRRVQSRIVAGSSRRVGGGRFVTFGALAVALLAMAVAGSWWLGRSEVPGNGEADGGPPRSVAVLPFSNLSPDPDNQYFSDGLAEEILNVLAKVNGLEVAARTSSFAYREGGKDVRQIGNELSVGAVLEGSVRKAGDRVRVTAQLIQTSDGFHLWSEAYDRRLDDIFQIQEDIARQIVRSMRVELNMPVDQAVARGRPTEDMEAYQLFLQARHLFQRRTEASLLRSVELYGKAIERDSTFAEAYGGLAITYQILGGYLTRNPGYDPLARSRVMAERGLELDSTLAQGYAVEARQRFNEPNPDLLGARAAYQRARRLDPDDPTVPLWAALVEVTAGRFDAADTLLERALELDPASGIVTEYMAWSADLRGNPDRAIDLHEQSMNLGYPWARLFLCVTAAINHRYEAVRARWCDPGSLGENQLGQVYIWQLDSIMQQAPDLRGKILQEAPPVVAVFVAPSLNLPDPFFSALETDLRASANHWSYVWHPAASAYRRDPRFVAWVRRMHLPEYWDATSWPDFCSRTQDGEIRCR